MIRRRDVENLLLFVALWPLVCAVVFFVAGAAMEVLRHPGEWRSAVQMTLNMISLQVLALVYIFGAPPAALASVLGTVLARALAGWRRLLAAPAIGAATTAALTLAWWWFHFRHSISVEGPVLSLLTASGAVAALVCTALIEWRAAAAARVPGRGPV
jgi:hypothetical protein